MGPTEVLTAAAVLLTAAAIYFHLKKFSYWSSRNIKGPAPWPILGTNIYYLFGNKLDVDAKWHRQYGKVYGLYEGYSPLLRVNDRELIEHIYVKQFRSFTDRHSEYVHDKIQKNWLLWVPGRQWSAKRALVSPMFTNTKMRLMARNMSGCINRFLKEVDKRSLGANEGTDSVREVSDGQVADRKADRILQGVRMNKTDISAMTLDVIGTNFYSLKLDTYRDKDDEFLRRAYDLAKFDIARFLVWILTPRRLAKLLAFDLFPYYRIEYFDVLAQKIISERRRAVKAPQKKLDVVQALMDAKLEDFSEQADADDRMDKLYSGQLSEEHRAEVMRLNTKPLTGLSDYEIRGQMTFLFIAGFETTAMAINFCLFELAHQSQTQDLLYDELTRVFGNEVSVLANTDEHFPSEKYSDLMNLTYLDAFISETLRLYAPIIDNNRRPNEPVVIPTEPVALPLPAGLPVSTNPFILHRDPDYWPEPEKFDLTRFLPENRVNIRPGTYMPFGYGSRNCLGVRFAMLEIKMALAKIVLNHRISPVSKEYPPKFQQNVVFLLLEKNDFTLVPRTK